MKNVLLFFSFFLFSLVSSSQDNTKVLNDKVVHRYVVVGSEKSYAIQNLEKGNYFFRCIKDQNQNGRWDTGDFKNQIEPEKVRWYNDPIVVRPNWEIDVVFETTKWR